jgi:hypothetical protein
MMIAKNSNVWLLTLSYSTNKNMDVPTINLDDAVAALNAIDPIVQPNEHQQTTQQTDDDNDDDNDNEEEGSNNLALSLSSKLEAPPHLLAILSGVKGNKQAYMERDDKWLVD